MKPPILYLSVLLMLLLAGCTREPGSTTLTKGTLRIDCDAAIYPALRLVAEEFHSQYPDARVDVRSVEAREATANFVNDSVHVIAIARSLNAEERATLAATKTWFEEYHVAQSAIAVLAHKENPVTELRMGQLDSILTGSVTAWPGWKAGGNIDIVVSDVNSSTNEVLRALVLRGKKFALSASVIAGSGDLMEHVRSTRNAIGVTNVAWLMGVEQEFSLIGLSRPGVAADSTQRVGKAYTPVQGYVYKGYYPLSTPVNMYSRELNRDVSMGFIAFATGIQGQKVFLKSGLVPVTMPVRLIQLTSEQVK
jgi:phosphate transport system substrate-binding protein